MDFWDFWIALTENNGLISTVNELTKSNLCKYEDGEVAEATISAYIYESIGKKLDTKAIKTIFNQISTGADSLSKLVSRNCLRILKANLHPTDYLKCRELVKQSVGLR